MNEFQAANLKIPTIIEDGPNQRVPPKPPWYKINVYRAVFSSLGSSGMGAIIRDSEGRLEAALGKNFHCPFGPLEAEAKAMEDGVQFAWDVGIWNVIFECDSRIVFDALNGLSDPPTIVVNIIMGIQ